MFGAVSERRWPRKVSGSRGWERRLSLDLVECRDAVSSVWLDSGLAADRCSVLLRRESGAKSRTLFATKDGGRECEGVLFLLEIRLSSGLGDAGVAGGGLGSAFEVELATLQGLSRLLSGDLWSRWSSYLSLIRLLPIPRPPMLALLR